ncbi:MAG TPA: ATP-dependent metallopeptidase FtsH/Yme1/Tma family protein [Sedimenticola thiotaurini]|uniref:ATP-dependent zinc metalloprotease FtsH n=1 Tax=Sedimenticola thiotaurini TaxID=1543721 RepID=A0A831W9S1_9GAMM|nr:ATP-dependent metallopeptidase FtsH/Yme1/Tma family protein [Sedimenticola thiotaurini]
MDKKNFSLNGNGDKPKIEINRSTPRKFWQSPNFTLIMYLLFIFFSFQVWQGYQEAKREEIPYSEFLQHVQNKEVQEAVVTDKLIRGTLKSKDERTNQPRKFITVPLWNMDLARLLEKQGVKYTYRPSSDWLGNFLFNWVLPFGLLFLLWGWMAKRMGSMGKGFLNLGNKVHIHPDSLPKVTFDDVAGNDEAKQELKETIDFLKDPQRIQRLGGRMPKGVLLVGPPGTGKTLMARAVAGEAGVPFFNISGSEFIEMFVGVGAARVREMFEQAREKAPCIIFIDELDAIGRARGAGPVMGGHDEREQTLNQLLTEMDGFDPSTGVVVMAATNRPEILDKALLRAGRFDRQILVDKPDLEAREEILRLHARRLKLADDVDLRVVAQRTPGFVGADLENICNEAAIRAVRENHDNVTMKDFEAAIDRVIAGPEKKHRTLNAEEKHRVAYHESGHTLVAETVPTGEPVHKVSIIPRGVAALGYTLQLPVDEKFLSTEQELKDQIAILLGGRVAEEIVLGDVSSGASNDLERASEIARSMVTQLGMSSRLGPLTWGKRRQLQYLGVEEQEERNYSDETASLIDQEVKALVEEGHRRAHEILTGRRDLLDRLARVLEEKEVISGEEVKRIIGSDAPVTEVEK